MALVSFLGGEMAAQTIAVVQQPHVEPTLLGETYGFWCQTLVLFLAAYIAWRAIKASRAIERKKAAAEVIFTSRQDIELVKAVRHIAAIGDGDKNMATYAKKENNDSDDSKSIRYALNHYEYISVGIAQGIYDEQIFKSSSYTTMTTLYKRTKPFVEAVRKMSDTKTIWQEFECLASRWIDDPLDHKSLRSVPRRRSFRKWLGQKLIGNQ